MAAIQFVGILSLAVLALIAASSADPEHVHTKHVIHAPLHIKMIHHHKIIKVPVVFRKHHHHHKHLSHEHVYIPLKEKPKPVYEVNEAQEEHPVKIIKIIHPVVEQQGGDSDEIDNGSQGHYRTQIGGGQGGNDYHSGSEKSDEFNSYEYDESQENGNYYYHGQH